VPQRGRAEKAKNERSQLKEKKSEKKYDPKEERRKEESIQGTDDITGIGVDLERPNAVLLPHRTR
jgi:hypothetical protein